MFDGWDLLYGTALPHVLHALLAGDLYDTTTLEEHLATTNIEQELLQIV